MMTDAAENGHRKRLKNHPIEKGPMVIELADSTEVGDASRPRSMRRAIPLFFLLELLGAAQKRISWFADAIHEA